MKRLTDRELATILAAASELTQIQHQDRKYVHIAYDLWHIAIRHADEERKRKAHRIEQEIYKDL